MDPARSNQSFRERLPRNGLEEFVSCVWSLRVSGEGPAYEHRTVPNGCAEVVFVRGADAVRLVGPRLEPVVEREPPATTIVGVRFRPGIGPRILGPPASELADQAIDLSLVWGRSATELGGRLAEALSPIDAVALLEDEILARRPAEGDLDPLLDEAVSRLQPWRSRDVRHTADDLFISPRQLRRRFAAALGCGPKMLQRIPPLPGVPRAQPARSRERGHARPPRRSGCAEPSCTPHEPRNDRGSLGSGRQPPISGCDSRH